jgi:AmmeMemoRadiSam system protein B
MASIRQPAVAGLFYPDDPRALHEVVQAYLASALPADDPAAPKALIAPHAGYIYSGPVAATAYAALGRARDHIKRVVLLGPAHRHAFRGLAAPSVEYFATPLGTIAIDHAALGTLAGMAQFVTLDAAHAGEHSLEVHLPFLQEVLGTFTLVPLVVGQAGSEEVAAVLEKLWGGPETLIVISTDLSHYRDYAGARSIDRTTCAAIESLRYEEIGHESACGRAPLSGLLLLARRRGMGITTLDLRNSGDTAGGRDRVVGYGSWALA